MGEMINDKDSSSETPKLAAREEIFQKDMENILVKVKNHPESITAEDVRRLSGGVDTLDEQSGRIISLLETLALANKPLNEQDTNVDQTPHASLLTVVKNLNAAVDTNPDHVTTEVLRSAQSIVNSRCIVSSHARARKSILVAMPCTTCSLLIIVRLHRHRDAEGHWQRQCPSP